MSQTKKRQAITFLTESSHNNQQSVIKAVMYQPRIADVSDDTLIALANLCITSLGQRHGLDRARQLIESTLFPKRE